MRSRRQLEVNWSWTERPISAGHFLSCRPLNTHRLWPHNLPVLDQNWIGNKVNIFSWEIIAFHCSAPAAVGRHCKDGGGVRVILYPSCVCRCVCLYVHASPSWGSPDRHPNRSKSDFTKRLHHLGGLLCSRRRDALLAGDCLRSFSQQLTRRLRSCASCLGRRGCQLVNQ